MASSWRRRKPAWRRGEFKRNKKTILNKDQMRQYLFLHI
jgi:hypothetical protein